LGYAELFFKSLISIISPQSKKLPKTPTDMLVVFDGEAKRDKKRAPKPEGYHAGIETCKDLTAKLFGNVVFQAEGEADDAIATAAARAKKDPTVELTIVASGDKDLQQLAGDTVLYYSLHEKSTLPIQWILNKWGVKQPLQVAVVLAILGDATDCIQGVHKWGPKKVAKIFEEVTADMDILAVAELAASKIPDKLLPDFVESLELTLLKVDVPNVPDPQPIAVAQPDLAEHLGLPGIRSMLFGLSYADYSD
jgi:5'-3' exonuclease